MEEKKKFKVPHTYVIIFCIIILMTILTWIIPAGSYDRVQDPATGRTVVDPESYHHIDQTPIGPFQMFINILGGMQAAAQVIFFVFVVAGAFFIIQSTEAINAAIARIALKFRNSGKILIPIVMFVFSLFGGTIGMAEESIIFIPMGVALARALGYDAIVGVSMVLLGAACGFSSGFMNPFTVGVAQGIGELPLFSGMPLRLVLWIVLVAVAAWYVIRYASKVAADPTKSLVRELEIEEADQQIDLDNLPDFTTKRKLIMLVVLLTFVMIIVGVMKLDWYMDEIAATFLIGGLISGFIYGYGPSEICKKFIEGAKDIAFGALIIGLARTILVTMQSGNILDTIVHGLASVMGNLPKSVTSIGMYITQSLINYLIPSGSGQAAATMPIMIPLADVLGINRQIAVLAFHMGDGFSNSLLPYSASCMGALSVAHVPWEKWAGYFIKLLGIWYVIGFVFMFVAQMINYS